LEEPEHGLVSPLQVLLARELRAERCVALVRDAEVGEQDRRGRVASPRPLQDDVARARELEGIGVDGVITDDPKAILASLGRA
jgi:hypothetical protein